MASSGSSREARTAASLSHPQHHPDLRGQASRSGVLYFVMKFIPGRPLDDIIREVGPLPIPMVQAILSQVGSALGYAHRRGIIHRDIKPANIMIDDEGWAVVTDFGIAKVAETQRPHHAPGWRWARPSYMSPEQCAAKEVTGRSDQYSLGVVAYEMLTGKQPFSGRRHDGHHVAHFHRPAAADNGQPVRLPRGKWSGGHADAGEGARRSASASMEDVVAAIGAPPMTPTTRRASAHRDREDGAASRRSASRRPRARSR